MQRTLEQEWREKHEQDQLFGKLNIERFEDAQKQTDNHQEDGVREFREVRGNADQAGHRAKPKPGKCILHFRTISSGSRRERNLYRMLQFLEL